MDYINAETIGSQIDNIVLTFFQKSGIDIYNITECKAVTHNTLTLCMMEIYNNLFKPSMTLWNNQKSLIDYDNTILLTVIANKFIELCLRFNKSLGIMQFSIMTGIHWQTLAEWERNKESNPARSAIVNNIRECHKMEQINILNESPVGALAVANNDNETGLNWSRQQAIEQASNAVYLIPSERLQRLGIDKQENTM